MIQRVVHDGWNCIVSVYNEEMETRKIEVRLRSLKAASALYRCITEMHSFFRCDTVNSEVSSQVYRDIKGLFASLFNENSTLGKCLIICIIEIFTCLSKILISERSVKNLNYINRELQFTDI